MKAELKNGFIIKKFIDTTKDIIDYLILCVDKNGMIFQGLQDTNIVFAQLFLKNENFQAFSLIKPLNYRISVFHLVKVFRSFNDDDIMTIEAINDCSISLTFNALKDNTTSIFTIPVIWDNEFKITIPKFDYNNIAIMSTNELSKITAELKNIAQNVEIYANKEIIKFNIDKSHFKTSKGVEYIDGGYVQIGTKNRLSNTKLYVNLTYLNFR